MLNFLPDAVLSLLQSESMRTAVETPFNTVIIVNSYDAFSDWPVNPNPVAVLNALAGLFYRHGQTAFVDLQSVPAENISVSVNSYGATTTTYRVPSPDLPLTRPLRDAGLPAPGSMHSMTCFNPWSTLVTPPHRHRRRPPLR